MAYIDQSEPNSAQAVMERAAQVRAFRHRFDPPNELKSKLIGVQMELTSVKAERDQYRALADDLRAANICLSNRLDRFTQRLSNLQRDAVIAQDVATEAADAEPKPPRIIKISIFRIIDVVCHHYRKSRNDLLSDRRTADLVRPRQVGMYLSKEMTPKSLPEIGRRFGGRDHTTVLHAHRKISSLMKLDRGLESDLKILSALLVSGVEAVPSRPIPLCE